jgi:hypothetical protein
MFPRWCRGDSNGAQLYPNRPDCNGNPPPAATLPGPTGGILQVHFVKNTKCEVELMCDSPFRRGNVPAIRGLSRECETTADLVRILLGKSGE